VRVFACVLVSLLVTASAAAAEPSLRHVEYDVTTQVDGRATSTHLVLDLVRAASDRSITLDLAEPDAADPVRVEVDARGVVTCAHDARLSREAKLLVYFFALGAQNMTGLARGDEWGADGATGDGARHRTRFRVVRTPGPGRLDIAFTRTLNVSDERADIHGRLLYDAFKVVPVSFDAAGEARDGDGAARSHDVRYAVRLTKDSQP
jgi:hypothetical protein